MTHAPSDLLHFLAERGHAPTCTDEEGLKKELAKGVITGYCGFDPTADSLHVGHMAQLMLLRRLQQCGHRPIALVGGATGRIGDPSFRDTSRPMLTDEQLAHNLAGLKQDISKFLRFDDSATGAILVDNYDWLGGIGYIEMLQEVGAHFTINRMLTMESVKLRLEREQPMTFLEFNYMIMQGYDFVELKKRYNCSLQISGMDQWGNMIQGVELGRRKYGFELFGVVQPLLTTSAGVKMGKSAGNAVWLNGEKKTPYDFWQYWRNCEDGDIGRWLRLFTELPIDEVKRLEALQDREINNAKKILATEVTALVHGRAAAEAAAKTAQETFEKGALGADLPVLALESAQMGTMGIIDLVISAGFASSRGDARKLIQGGGIRINDEKVADPQLIIAAPLFKNGELKLSKGQKSIVRVKAA